MKNKIYILYILTLVLLIINGCDKSEIENISDNDYINFTLVGKLDGEEINYSSQYKTVRDSFYSYTAQFISKSEYIEFVRYSSDFESYIEMCLTLDTLSKFDDHNYLYNALNYRMIIGTPQKEHHLELESTIIFDFDTVYTTPFIYSNIVFDNDNNSISGNFSYSIDSLINSTNYYTINGYFDIILNQKH